MATFNATITASADDAQEASNVVTLDDTNINVNATTQTGGLRFQNVTIPQASTINSATLSVYLPSGSFDDPYITIKGQDTDDAAAFVASNNDITNRTTTTASVTWDASSLSTGVKVSPDISTVIQEIIDRPGWASGNDLALIISAIDNTSLFRFRGYDSGLGDYATLDIDYTAPSIPTTTNLVSWWSLDETSGTRADSHGSNDLTDTNTVGYATGKQSNAADFVASNVEYLTVDSNSSLQVGGTDFTFTLWVYVHAIAANSSYLLSKVASGQLEFQLTIRVTDSLARFVLWDAGTTAKGLNSSSALSLNTWYFLAIRWNNTTKLQEIIINAGTPDTATQTGASITSGSGRFRIANSDGGVVAVDNLANHDGLIDEVAFWKKVLTDDELHWLYNSGNGRAYSELGAPSSGGQPPRSLHQFRQRIR